MPKYAYYDPNAPAPSPVLGWFDTDSLVHPNLPPPSELLEITDVQMANVIANLNVLWAVQSGSLVSIARTLTVPQALGVLANQLANVEGLGVQFTPTGASAPILFATDANAQVKYTAEWNALSATPPLRVDGDFFIAGDGTPVPMSNVDAKALLTKAFAYFRACTANYAILQPKVLADPTTNIMAGWPSNT